MRNLAREGCGTTHQGYMSRRDRFKVVFGVIVLALIIASAAFLFENPGINMADIKVSNVDVKVADAEVVMDGFSFSKTDDDSARWRLDARRAELKKDTGMARLEDLEAVFESDNGTVLTLTADRGEFDTATNSMRLSRVDNDIKVSSNEGYDMYLKDLEWDESVRELSTDNGVVIEGERGRLEGGGMVAKADMEEIRIVNGVRTTFNMDR
jgi:LPS export ABC transporter protein LptC